MNAEEIVKYWLQVISNQKPYVHPDDRALTDAQHYQCSSYAEFAQDSNLDIYADTKFHLNLLPSPYEGNISTAKIFLLLLNPGFSPIDYYAEFNDTEYNDYLRMNVEQKIAENDFPFLSLNPKFMWTGTGQYWLKKLKDFIKQIQMVKKISFIDSLRYISRQIAILQLVPYHSKSYEAKYSKMIKSADIVKQYVHEHLVPRAKAGDICIICLRKSSEWGLEEGVYSNIIVYPRNQARNPSLRIHSPGGPTIWQYLDRFYDI